jgi:hypothetical protein
VVGQPQIVEPGAALVDGQPVDAEGGRRALGIGRGGRNEIGKVERAVRPQHCIDLGPVDPQFAQAIGRAEQRAHRKGEVEMPDGHHRRGFMRGWPVGQGDAVDIGFESERIEADFAKREGLVQVVLHPLRTLCPHEVGHEIEPGQRIGAHQQDQRGQSPDKLVQHRLGTKNRHNVPRLHRSRAFLHIRALPQGPWKDKPSGLRL